MKIPFEDLVGRVVLASSSRDSAFFGRLAGFDPTHVVLDSSVEIIFDTRAAAKRHTVESNDLSVYEELSKLNPNDAVYKLTRRKKVDNKHLPRTSLTLEPYTFDNSLFDYFSGEDAKIIKEII